jgi:glyoxylase-like metal-dependent hydrolase (beta-lactamase superfamily II)
MATSQNVILPFVQPLAHGIYVIDTGFHRESFDASYLIVENGRAAFVDTGTNDSVPRLLDALAVAGVQRQDVDWVIATHVHLDHAGGVGQLMRQLPSARLVVHPHGARHLIDPTRLINSARMVYGDAEVARSYGDVIGVAPQRVVRTHDNMTVELSGRVLKFLDTPGHARHHHCIWDERTRGFFTGDTFGLSYREFDTAKGAWLMPTTTPIQFQPDAMRSSVRRLLDYQPQCMYLTHFGRVTEATRLASLMLEQLDAMVELALKLSLAILDVSELHRALVQGFENIYIRSLRDHGCTLGDEEVRALLRLDTELNAQGMAIWLKRRHRETSNSPTFGDDGQ